MERDDDDEQQDLLQKKIDTPDRCVCVCARWYEARKWENKWQSNLNLLMKLDALFNQRLSCKRGGVVQRGWGQWSKLNCCQQGPVRVYVIFTHSRSYLFCLYLVNVPCKKKRVMNDHRLRGSFAAVQFKLVWKCARVRHTLTEIRIAYQKTKRFFPSISALLNTRLRLLLHDLC